MVTKVQCVTKGCEWEKAVFTTTALFIAKIAPLDGPYICPKCEQAMKVVARVPANYKGNGGKKGARGAQSQPAGKKTTHHKVAKKVVRGFAMAGTSKQTGTRKTGTRKSVAKRMRVK